MSKMTVTPNAALRNVIAPTRLTLFEESDVPPKCLLFCRYRIYFDRPSLATQNGLTSDVQQPEPAVGPEEDLTVAQNYALAGGAHVESEFNHVGEGRANLIVCSPLDTSRVNLILSIVSKMNAPVRVIDALWFSECWKHATLLDEEEFKMIVSPGV